MNEHSTLLAKILDSAFRLRVSLSIIFITVMAITIAVTFLSKKQYGSTMQLIFRDAREKPLVAADKSAPESNPDSSQELIESHADAEYEMLAADDILERAVLYRANVLPGAPNPAPGSAEMAKEIKKMSARLKITPVKKTPIIEVTYRDLTPEASQQVLQEVQRADLEKHLKVLRPSGTSKVFSDLARTYDERLTNAQRELSAFQVKNNLLSLSAEEDSISKDRDATRSALLQEEANLSGEEAQVGELHSALEKTPARIPTTSRESANSYSIQQVTGVLVDLINRRTQMLTRYQPTDRLVTELEKQIADTDSRLQKLKSEPTVEKDADNNPVWMQTEQQLAAARVAVAASKTKSQTLAAQLDKIDSRLNQLAGIAAENDRLERSVDELKDSQRLYSDKLNSELVEDILDKDKLGNIAVAMEPTFSRHPVSPKVPLNLALGFLTSIALCSMFLFAIESHRTTFHSPAELSGMAGIRVLSSVPTAPARLLTHESALIGGAVLFATPANRSANHKGVNDGHDAFRS